MSVFLIAAWNWFFASVRDLGLRYWMSAIIVLIASVIATPFVYDFFQLDTARSRLFQWLAASSPRPLEPRFVKVVLIGDDEYWVGDLAGRRPIKRDYLADLVTRLDQAKAQVIALDFDLRLADPASNQVPHDYEEETATLIGKIVGAAASGTKLVLSRALWTDGKGGYVLDPDAYQAFGLCVSLRKDGGWDNPGTPAIPVSEEAARNISCGYIALPYDELVLPGQLKLANAQYLDSFALAIARAKNPDAVAGIDATLSYANYIARQTLEDKHAIFWAGDLMHGKVPQEELRGQTIIVGADWSSLAAGRGQSIDVHQTPVGTIVGALIHDNFVEALLDSRVYVSTSSRLIEAAEILFGVIATILFALLARLWTKLVGVVALSALLILIQRTVLHEFGIFFDAFIPLLAVWLHSVYDRLIGAEGG
jgi:CHASE2 domain-containing sensor protein